MASTSSNSPGDHAEAGPQYQWRAAAAAGRTKQGGTWRTGRNEDRHRDHPHSATALGTSPAPASTGVEAPIFRPGARGGQQLQQKRAKNNNWDRGDRGRLDYGGTLTAARTTGGSECDGQRAAAAAAPYFPGPSSLPSYHYDASTRVHSRGNRYNYNLPPSSSRAGGGARSGGKVWNQAATSRTRPEPNDCELPRGGTADGGHPLSLIHI